MQGKKEGKKNTGRGKKHRRDMEEKNLGKKSVLGKLNLGLSAWKTTTLTTTHSFSGSFWDGNLISFFLTMETTF